MYAITETTALEALERCKALMPLHAAEMVHLPELMRVNMHAEHYATMDRIGAVTLLACKDDEVVGYACSVFTPHPHHAHLRLLMNDAIYVHPDHRGLCGLRLIRRMEEIGKERGAHLVCWNAQPDTPFEALLPRLEYKPLNTTYFREV
jgi:GNAT superfamily N-acetyltransferase